MQAPTSLQDEVKTGHRLSLAGHMAHLQSIRWLCLM
jgi:hypothetical protein